MSDTIDVPVWWCEGGRMLRRSFLEPYHPESEYNYVRKHYPTVEPTDYGIDVPVESKQVCSCCGEDDGS